MSSTYRSVLVVIWYSCYCFVFVFIDMLRCCIGFIFFLQAEDGIRDLVRSRGLGDVYKRQARACDEERSCTSSTASTGVAGQGRAVGLFTPPQALSLIHI